MTKKRVKKWWFYVGGGVIFLLVFYIALFAGTDYWKVKLPVLADVKPFSFVDQSGRTITDKDLQGKVCVVSFFFTTCPGICPRMNYNIRTKVYDQFRSDSDFLVVSNTSDPDRDSVARMKQYADSLGVNDGHWLFLTGSKLELYKAARQSFLLDDQNNSKQKLEDQFIHTQLIALVDKDGRVRGIYDGLNQDELAKLDRDIRTLLKEPQQGAHFVNGLFNNNPS